MTEHDYNEDDEWMNEWMNDLFNVQDVGSVYTIFRASGSR